MAAEKETPALGGGGGYGGGPVRIYLGGVSAGVTAADVENAFAPLGRVAAVELVRSKDRSFAYMDFHPNSDKALTKLFTTYNGCTWKGGKLKVEKAKEHYLVRLKREWAEDAEPTPTAPVEPNVQKPSGNSKTAEKLNQENMQLRIYFPKLRRVKSLPFKGTGKHKYSFQRIEVPPLPIHFCDCEEHCRQAEMVRQEYFSSSQNKIRERARSTMKSVMIKHIEMDAKAKKTADGKMNSVKDGNADGISITDENMEEVQAMDADNLVTNIGVGGNGDALDAMLLKGVQTLSATQDLSKSGEVQPFKGGNVQDKSNSRKRQKTGMISASDVTPDEKNHPAFGCKIAEEKLKIILPSLQSSEGQSKGQCQEVKIPELAPPIKTQTETNSTAQSTKGQTWLQKSSWKNLVGEMASSSFSISQALPGISAVAAKSPLSNDSTFNSATVKKKAKSDQVGSKSLQVNQNVIVAPPSVEVPKEDDRAHLEDELKAPQRKDLFGSRTLPKVSFGEVCTFMRNADSEKQWAKTKAALSGYLKKKSSEVDTSKSSKYKPTRK